METEARKHLNSELDNSWVLFELAGQDYGIKTEFITEMVILGDVVPMPQQGETVRGVFNLRGRVIPVVDMRRQLGMPGICDEVSGVTRLLAERQKDHENWLRKLREAVEDGHAFEGELDPTKCAFGKWYYNYKAESHLLRMQMAKFEEPHRAIHGIAEKAMELVNKGEKDEAERVVEHAWNTDLHNLVELFEDTHDFVCRNLKEVVLVSGRNGRSVGLIVDKVREVRDILPGEIEEAEGVELSSQREYVYGFAKTDDGVKILLDYENLVSEA